MNIFKKVFRAIGSTPVPANTDFWAWFARHAGEFHAIVDKHINVNDAFLDKLMPRLQKLNEGFYCLTGMLDDATAELIISAEGDIKTFVFVEQLVADAPAISGWKFTALKPPTAMETFKTRTNGFSFHAGNIWFHSEEDPYYPDKINIHLHYDDYTEENKDIIYQGCFLFLENSLGELNVATLIDELHLSTGQTADEDRIPINKLEQFLIWRQKEFLEKYEHVSPDPETYTHSIMEAKDDKGRATVAMVNTGLLEWDAKASHRWMTYIDISFDGKGRNGMPDQKVSDVMNAFEDELLQELPDGAGYLNLGRETYNGKRTIIFACREFREVSRITAAVIGRNRHLLDLTYDIEKDKYWSYMERYRVS